MTGFVCAFDDDLPAGELYVTLSRIYYSLISLVGTDATTYLPLKTWRRQKPFIVFCDACLCERSGSAAQRRG